MFAILLLTVCVALIAYSFHRLAKNNAQYFEERNLKYNGGLDGVVNFIRLIFGKLDMFEMTKGIYDKYPDEPIYGAFDFNVRQYFFRDPEAYKKIAIKDFDHFVDHRAFVDENVDELFGNSLVTLHGEKWRQMRATLSPAFTGSKMRLMFELVSECADEIVKHFAKQSAEGQKINLEMKDFFSRYTNDVIATCAFGIKVNSFAEPDNEFYQNGIKLVNFTGSGLAGLKFFINFMFPKIGKFFGLKFFDDEMTNSFKNMILDTMEMRQKNNIYRPDMINMLMQVREGTFDHQSENKTEEKTKDLQDGFATVEESDIGKSTVSRKWNDTEIIAQCFLFFFGGFESSSTMLTFIAYELVANPDVQQKLYEEIAEVNNQLDGKRVTYDALQRMKYLDQVVSETLRKWPAAIQLDRTCVKDYTYDDGDKLKFTIEKGANIIFPVYGIHRDPKYYPDPDRFDPDRFSDENKHNITIYAPFGLGPRNCIGSRFALMQLKGILYYLVLNFSLEPNKDTQIPLRMKKSLQVATEKGVHCELKPRKN